MSLIDYERMTPLRALNCRSMMELDVLLQEATSEALGWSREDWRSRWRRTEHGDRTARPWCAPRTEQLFDEWKERRDPSWLYAHPEYVMDPLACGVMDLTPKNVKESSEWLARELFYARDELTIADLGAGPGITSIMLARTFPTAQVHWVEISEDCRKLAQVLAARAGVENRIIWGGPLSEKYDVVFALELVEHLYAGEPSVGDPFSPPYSDAIERTTAIVQATAWTAELGGWSTLGHFLDYRIDGELVPVMRAKRAFHASMRRRGWIKRFQGFNGTPGVWTR